MPSNAGRKVSSEAQQRAEKYKRALRYLDSCPHFSYKDLVKTNRIAGNVMPEAELRRLWKMSERTFEGAGGHRQILRDTLIEGIEAFELVASKLERKWWQFWK